LEFGYPPWTRSVGVHFKPWGLAPFLSMPAAELCDRPVSAALIWHSGSGSSLASRRSGWLAPFRAFTGLTPTRYVEVRRRFLSEHPGHVLAGWPLPAD
jgi:hypothetical protein